MIQMLIAIVCLTALVAFTKSSQTEVKDDLPIDLKLTKGGRGFEYLCREVGGGEDSLRVLQQSSAIGDYDDSFDVPGSSFLWVGEHHHLNREEITELSKYLVDWDWSSNKNQNLVWRCYLPENGTQNIVRQEGDTMFFGANEVPLHRGEVALVTAYMRTWLETGYMAGEWKESLD